MLPGQAVSLSLKVLGHRNEARRLQVYNLNITDTFDNRHLIQMVSVDEIRQIRKAQKVWSLVALFPGAGQIQDNAFNRPHGTVHLLLGMASRSLHSRVGCKAGELRLNKPVFRPGCVLTGKISSPGSSGSSILILQLSRCRQ